MNTTISRNLVLSSKKFEKEKAYWMEKLGGKFSISSFSCDFVGGKVDKTRKKCIEFHFPDDAYKGLIDISNDSAYGIFIILLTGLYYLLSRYSNNEDIIIGSPVFKQDETGEYINRVLALKCSIRGEMAFKDLLYQVKRSVEEANENMNYPIEKIMELLNFPSDNTGSSCPLFDTMVVFGNIHEESGISDQPCNVVFWFNKARACLECRIHYNPVLYSKGFVKRLGGHLINYCRVVTRTPLLKLSEIEILSPGEKEQLLIKFNDTIAGYPREKTIAMLLEDRVEKTPDAAAVVFDNRMLTYRELNEKSNQLAHLLNKKGVQPDTIVAIIVERSIEMVIGVLGILKTGGAYLPIELNYPAERINYILADSGANVLVTDSSLAKEGEKVRGWVGKKNLQIVLLDFSTLLPFYPSTLPSFHFQLSPAPTTSLAYIIYTSGSTGRPKGVMIEHRSVVNILYALDKKYPFSETDTYLLKTSFVFDVSIVELFGWFLGGGRLALLEKNGEKDPKLILDFIVRTCVTHINFVPSMFRTLLEILDSQNIIKLSRLKYIFLAGEALSSGLVEKFIRLETGVVLENIYGPTESAIYASQYSLACWDRNGCIPIGKPLANIRLYILDRYQNLQPQEVPGELVIAGHGVAQGYLNNPELTAEKFKRAVIRHSSFVIRGSIKTNNRLYRTGDLARWLPDGNIEFLGRIDHQVKIRGYRIELGEIESQLRKIDEIREALVISREDETGDKYLSAYIVSNHHIPVSQLRECLLEHLPEYMVPVYFIRLNKIPLTTSGKVDRKALPHPRQPMAARKAYTAPRDRDEKKMVELWCKVLDIGEEKIGLDSNYFHIGGHSLNALILLSWIHKELDTIVPLVVFFQGPTIRKLSAYIKKVVKEEYAPVKNVEKQEYYDLSHAQKRLYLLQQMDEQGIGYNMPMVYILEGDVDVDRIEETFRQLIERHESFRTSFGMIEDRPLQKVHDKVEFKIEYHYTGCKRQTAEKISQKTEGKPAIYLSSEFIRPFDLSQAPLLRVGLLKPEEEKHILIIDMHHIISDGTSMGVLIKEFMSLYSREKLPQLRIQYKDFTGWQNSKKVKESIKKQESYWLKLFDEEIPVLDLPTDYPRPVVQSFEGSAVDFVLDKEKANDLKQLAAGEESSLFMVLFSIFNILLSKLSNQEDIVTGTPIAGRRHADIEHIIGMFVNTLALRIYPSGEKRFKEFLNHVKEVTLNAFENQDYQFEDLVEKVEVKRDISRNPLFDVMFTSQNIMTPIGTEEIPEEKMEELKVKPYSYENRTSKFDLTLTNTKIGKILHFRFQYCTKLFQEETIHAFIRYFKQIISTVVEIPGKKISEIEIMTGEEKQQLLFDLNHTEAGYPGDKTIHQLFEEQVVRTPGKIAVVFEDKKLTYKELDAKTRQLAWRLREKGVIDDAIVGIMVPPGLEMPLGILAVLKAGGGYLPLDPEYPGGRINYILDDSNSKLLLLQNHLQSGIKFYGEVINIQDPGIYSWPGENTNPENINDSKSIAYTIYTSGTTGNPKGVLVKHENLTNYVSWVTKKTLLTGEDKTILTSSFAFDLGYTSVFPSILNGGELHLLPKEMYLLADGFLNYIRENNISYLKVTPSFLSVVVNDPGFSQEMCRRLRLAVVGGEAINLKDIKKAHAICGNIKIMNHYGPTEAAIGCIARYIDFNRFAAYEKHPTIGKPIDNVKVYILDKNLKLLPVGIAGELCISGICLARGYLNQPELTAQKFVEEVTGAGDRCRWKNKKLFADVSRRPDASRGSFLEKNPPGRRRQNLYKTGDLAKWMPDGTVEFLGRIDNQVKISGYRIELGEIESQLLDHEDIKEVVVSVRREDGKGTYLCAYIASSRELSIPGIRERLSENLPDYMIPSYFVSLEHLPLTPNGKIDLDALPLPQRTTSSEYAGPRNEIEEILLRIWSEVLGYSSSEIGIDDNFFEWGGHSMKAIKLLTLIHKVSQKKIPLAEIFKHPTIRGISHLVTQMEKYRYTSIEPTVKKEFYPLSFAQKRLYFLWQMDSTSTNYNLPRAMIIEGKPDKKSFEMAFRALISRHEALRTSFHLVDGKPVQKIHEKVEFEIEYYDFTRTQVEVKEEEQTTDDRRQTTEEKAGTYLSSVIRYLSSEFIHPFDLTHAPLLRVGLMETGQDRYLLLLDKHHIITDGVTEVILIRELIHLYEGQTLGQLPLQYKDYSEWQNKQLETGEINRQKEYWLNRFNGKIPILNMHTDYRRQAVPIVQGDKIHGEIGPGLTGKIKDLTMETNTTLFMVLLAAWYILLSKYTKQEDITVGIPAAGRSHPDLEHITGMFVNTLAMRNYPGKERNFADFLQEVKTNAVEDYENQDYPFDDLVHQLDIPRYSHRNPLFDVLFVSENIDMPELAVKGLRFRPYSFEHPITHMDLVLYFTAGQETIHLILEYSTALFKEETAKRMLKHYNEILMRVVENKRIALKDITISHKFLTARSAVLQEEDVDFIF